MKNKNQITGIILIFSFVIISPNFSAFSESQIEKLSFDQNDNDTPIFLTEKN